MYNFIYYFIYSFVKKRNAAPESYSTGAVLLMIIFHLVMIFGIIRFYFDWRFPRLNEEYLPNKLLLLPFAFFVHWMLEKYYEPRTERICMRYNEKYGKGKRNLYSAKNIILVIALYIFPLLIGIKFVNMSV